MSVIQMASVGKFPYQRVKPETGFDDDDERDRMVLRSRKWYRFRRIPIRRRFRLKVSSLRRFWRKKARLVSAMKTSCANIMKRFKEGQVHFSDLFAGNYMFTQVNPTSLKGHYINGLSSKFSLSKMA